MGLDTTTFQVDLLSSAMFLEMVKNGREHPMLLEQCRYPVLRGVYHSHVGNILKRDGQAPLTPSMPYAPTGVYRFYTSNVSFPMFDLYAMNGDIYAFNESATSSQNLTNTGAVDTATGIDFVSLNSYAFWADGVNPPMKWDGILTSAVQVGIAAPTDAPTIGRNVGGGALTDNASGDSQYQWTYTYSNSTTGVESNPSPAGNLGTGWPTSNYFDGDSAGVNYTAPTVPGVDTVNIYRTGGTDSLYHYVASVPVPSIGTTYYDTTADTALSDTQLAVTHGQPPVDATFFFVHKNRLWASGSPTYPCRVWFSGFSEPDYWVTTEGVQAAPFADLDVLNDGGFFDIDEDYGNPIVGYGAIGSLLLCFRRLSHHAILGDTLSDIQQRKVSDRGCMARRTIVQAQNTLVFQSPDGMCFVIDPSTGEQPQNISYPLEATFKAMQPDQLTGACACYHDQRYYLSVPGFAPAQAQMFAFDMRPGVMSWCELSDNSVAFTQMYASLGQDLFGEVLGCTRPGYTDPAGDVYNGIVSAFNKNYPLTPVDIDIKTPAIQCGRTNFTKRMVQLRIDGTCQSNPQGAPMIATVTAYSPDGSTNTLQVYCQDVNGGTMLECYLPMNIVGRDLSVEISGNAVQFTLNEITFSFSYIRELRPIGLTFSPVT
nr:hypothetical protein [uncultured Rhodopila sp.]